MINFNRLVTPGISSLHKQDDVTHPPSHPLSKDQRVHCITQSRWGDFRHTTISGTLFLNNSVKLF